MDTKNNANNKNEEISNSSLREPKVQKALTHNSYMRGCNIRVSRINHIKSYNEALGLKPGDTYTIEKNDLIDALERWSRSKPFDYYLIEHNSDKNNVHYHICIVFKKKSSATFTTIKNKFPYGDIERTGSVPASVQYLIHMNDPEKNQYDAKEIITNNPAKLESYLLHKCGYSQKARLEIVIDKILSGELKGCDIDLIEPDIYIRYKKKIDAAFEYRRKTLLKSSHRDVTVVVIQGPSRTGKSTYAREWSKANNKSYRYSSAGKHSFEDYQDEDVYILDDWNYNDLSITDFLKVTDPNINVPLPARYHNIALFIDTLFIITNTDFLDWYQEEQFCLREAVFKRVSCVLVFDKTDEPFVSEYIKCRITEDPDDKENGFCLEPIDTPTTFDLRKYIDIDEAIRDFNDEI